jgi:hypothetical protein
VLGGSRGLTIQLRDEGSVYNVVFRNIKFTASCHADPWWGHGEGISLTAMPRTPETAPGTMHNITLQNISGRAENSARIQGSPTARIHEVLFDNVAVTLARWTKYRGGLFDNRPTKVLTPVEAHGTPGFSIRNADGITLKNCAVRWSGTLPEEFSNALEAESVTGLRLTGFKGPAAHPARDEAILIQ